MASSGEEARVPIGIPVETNARDAAGDVDQLRASIDRSNAVIKDAMASMRGLRGKSEEVKAAKDQLKATIERERQAVSKSTLAMLKQGTSLERLAKQEKAHKDAQKKSAEQTKAVGDALGLVSPKVGALRDGIKMLGETAAKGGNLGIMALAAAGAVVAIAAVTAAVVGVVALLGKWVLKNADLTRSMALVRQASTRNAQDATNLGQQVDALARKVPTATENLNELAASLARSRLGGQATVDTLNAVAQANAAIGDQAGAKLREIVERGRLVNRMFLNWQELQGTGIDVDDIAGALADRMKVSVGEARKALFEGRVVLGDGAAAMRAAVEKKFGGINLEKMLSFDGISQTIGKLGRELTKGVDLKPLAKSAADLLKTFDQSSATGVALKGLVSDFGNGLVKVFVQGTPIAKAFIRQIIIGALDAQIAYLEFRLALSDAINALEKPLKALGILDAIDKLSEKVPATELAFDAMTLAVRPFADVLKGITSGLKLFTMTLEKAEGIYNRFAKAIAGPKSVGGAVVDGILSGFKDGESKLAGGAKSLANVIEKAMKGELEIRSPSRRARREIGQNFGKGVAGGIDDEKPNVDASARKLAPNIGGGGGATAAAASSAPTVNVRIENINVGDVGADGEMSPAKRNALRAVITQILKEAVAQAGFRLGEVG